MSFLNPIMLAGLAAISVPIIIHLLNRRKFHKVVWAAMRFLQNGVEQNRCRRFRLSIGPLALCFWSAVAGGCSCNESSRSSGLPFASVLITNFGKHTVEEGTWTIEAKEQDGTVTASYDYAIDERPALGLIRISGTNRISMSPSRWQAKAGWCVFVEDEKHFWAYDGETNLWLLERRNESSVAYGLGSLPRPIPLPLLKRLSPSAQALAEK